VDCSGGNFYAKVSSCVDSVRKAKRELRKLGE
jgi:hypothetical protein